MIKYPRTSSGNSSGFFDDDEPMNPYQTPPQSPATSPSAALASQCLQRHIIRMFSTEDASGTSAVAIDNKIEQAMDLVKSHLMIAVREEVEVLKEKISELMDKINQLEVENTILKANMSQETLQQLQMQMQIAGSTPTNGSNMITAAPTPAAITAGPQTAAAAPTAVGSTQSSNAATAAATPQSNVGSGTATPTTQQQPIATTVEQQQDATVQNIEENVTAAATNGPMS